MAKKRRRRLSPDMQEQYAERFELWAKGASDGEIADAQGRHPSTIHAWRNKERLPVNEPITCPYCIPHERMDGVLVSPGKDLYRYWKCPKCGGEFWPDDREKEAD
jgi:hypothetical protein